MHYVRLTQNLEQYSRSKADVSATDPHLDIYETIRKHLKRSRTTLFKMFGEKELTLPPKKPILISKVDFKNSLSQFQGILEKKIEGFMKSVAGASGREVDFLKFAHKVGYVMPSEEGAGGLGASMDLGKSALFNLSQAFGSRDEMKRKFYTEFLKVLGAKNLGTQNLFLKEDPHRTGLVSKVNFNYRISNTFANTEADTWMRPDVIDSVAEEFIMEGSGQVNLKAFFDKVGTRQQELYSINYIYDSLYKQLNFKHLSDLYDLFKAEDT